LVLPPTPSWGPQLPKIRPFHTVPVHSLTLYLIIAPIVSLPYGWPTVAFSSMD
jgi:hypothetical protein